MLAMVLVAYGPAMHGGFLWDDDVYVQHNPTLRSLEGLRRIWLEPGATPQYYPLVFTTFWFEWRLWSADPTGYHVVNALLHALNAILLWGVLVRMKVPGGWFAAALFALHPVQVESVAWISERKNVLSGALVLGATLAYLRLIEPSPSPLPEPGRHAHRWHYIAACVLFFGSLLSKTVTCTWPAAMGLILWWKRGRLEREHVLRLAPLLLIGAVMGLWTAWVEKRFVRAEGAVWTMTVAEHVLLAGRALCFYFGKLVWPDPLICIYPRWTLDAGDWRQWLYPLICAVALFSLIVWRRRIGRGPLAAALFFGGTLFPALGFFNVYFMRFSYVADHFQYLAGISVMAVAAAGISRFRSMLIARSLQAVLILLLGVNTWAQATAYVSAQEVWADTLKKNPGAWLAHNNLAVLLEREGRIEEAERHFRAALALQQDLSKVHGNLASLLADRGDFASAMPHFLEAIRIAPEAFDARYNLAVAYQRQQDWAQAASEYREAIRLRSSDIDARVGLATALLKLGDRDAARLALQEALRLDPQHTGAAAAWEFMHQDSGPAPGND